MKKTLPCLAALLALVLVGSARAEEGEKTGGRWTLDLAHGRLSVVPVQSPAGGVKSYHYITLKVTNSGALPRDWYPVVRALTDTGKEYVAMGYDEALGAVRGQEGNDALVPIGSTKGRIAAGAVLDTVAIFGPIDPLYDRIRVRLTGLADPVAIYKIERYDVEVAVPDAPYAQADEEGVLQPVTKALTIQDVAYVFRNEAMTAALKKQVGEGELPKPASEYWEVSERRVYEMIYERLGDEFQADDDPITFKKEQWIVVGDVRLLRKIQM